MNSLTNSSPLNILWTVDVEDYYMSPESILVSTWDKAIYEDRIAIGCHRLLELFSRSKIRATWFFLGWVAEKHPELVQAVHQQGHEIGTHTYDHRPVHSLTYDEFRESLNRSCDILKEITGEPVLGLRAPEWSIRSDREEVFSLLQERGFEYDSSLNPMATYLYGEKGLPRFPYQIQSNPTLWEIPPASIRLLRRNFSVGGGFFLRALPLFYMRWAIRRYNLDGYPAVVYIHPWELDPDHPQPSMSLKERLIHNRGIRTTQRKMNDLLSQSKSQTIIEYVRSLQAKVTE